MDREILFRGKRTDNGEWVEGCLLIDYVTGRYFIHAYGNSVNESDKVGEEGCLKFFTFEVDSETVCQYTGLQDKNGRKIFDGDIVKQFADCSEAGESTYYSYQIKWNKGYGAFVGYEIYTKELFLLPELEDVEVIGNIFDNPELMEKSECGECKCRNCFSKSECCLECEGAILECKEYSETDINNPEKDGWNACLAVIEGSNEKHG